MIQFLTFRRFHQFPGSTFKKMVDLHRFLGFELSGLPRFVTFLLTLFPTESSASNSLKPKNINFKAKFLTTFDPFCSALIGALVMSISDSFMLGIRRYLRFDAPLRRFLCRRRSRYCRAARSASSAVLPAAQASTLRLRDAVQCGAARPTLF